MKKLKVVPDVHKNRLYFTIAGTITKKELNSFYTDVRFGVDELRPGFNVISDFSECQFVFLNVVPTFRKIMAYLCTNGAGEMVGVIRRKGLFHRQVQLATIFQGYLPVYVSSLQEAEAKLENSIQRTGLRFSLKKKKVDYKTSKENGTGYILNISISGCAIKLASTPLSIDEEIKLTIPFTTQDKSSDVFVFDARVVRVEDDSFAVEFTGIEDTRKEQLWETLIYESQREIAS